MSPVKMLPLLFGLALGPACGSVREVPVAPQPCILPARPEPPEFPGHLCLTPAEAARQAAYEDALAKYLQRVDACPLVKEVAP